MIRFRITYTKGEELRYTSNLDVHKVWERTIRRAHLPIAYSQGFHPQPRINQASPLPLGITGKAEMVEIWLEEDLEISAVHQALQKAVPPGILVQSIEIVDPKDPAIQTRVRSAEYRVEIIEPIDLQLLETSTAELLNASSVLRERRGKTYDLRPLIEELTVVPSLHHPMPELFMRLISQEGATGRADEVMSALQIPIHITRIERTRLLLQ